LQSFSSNYSIFFQTLLRGTSNKIKIFPLEDSRHHWDELVRREGEAVNPIKAQKEMAVRTSCLKRRFKINKHIMTLSVSLISSLDSQHELAKM